ncbi:hypothetical protein P153DRAFT_395284 [Dothidotthia symphoricarpi CBS 119687]|uniref:Uncharacterized protein n=1 Tax=Dothidotthia symphoricarpi CBS 119687 TaxID=1392245 RepID=A0A6A6AID5_9PLEO|nr:uncharacterized protein P153DRAFT_395284 [Dothidotthia symphoricarpi CBS 119687]KAF2130875.1 hypothetical protein P153DRAFT_395284 [Dothidotthia symphoricarpi CBS 119687]
MEFGKPWDEDHGNSDDEFWKKLRVDKNAMMRYGICMYGSGIVMHLLGFVGTGQKPTGFNVGGVLGGSLAATWQSTIGNIPAGSLFSRLQSAAMGGTSTKQHFICAGLAFTSTDETPNEGRKAPGEEEYSYSRKDDVQEVAAEIYRTMGAYRRGTIICDVDGEYVRIRRIL